MSIQLTCATVVPIQDGDAILTRFVLAGDVTPWASAQDVPAALQSFIAAPEIFGLRRLQALHQSAFNGVCKFKQV